MRNKTPWHLAINGGFVPILELPDGTTLHESKILMDYAEEAYPDQGYSTLPSDPVLRAKIRLAIPLIDNLAGAYYPLYMKKKSFNEDDLKALKAKLQAIEDFLGQHQKENGLAFGTENPTQLDIHFYPLLSRTEMLSGSVFDDIAKQIDFDNSYPRAHKLVLAVRARPEFAKVLTQKVPQHHLLSDIAALPEGQRAALTLPVKFE